MEQIPTFPIFTPDYERIKYAIDSIKSVYAGQNLTHDEDEDISEYTGIRVLNLRSLAAIKKMNRREKYIKNETKAMYTKIDKIIKRTNERVKTRKKRKSLIDKDDSVDDSILGEEVEVPNLDDSHLSLSQDSFNTLSTMSSSFSPSQSLSQSPSPTNQVSPPSFFLHHSSPQQSSSQSTTSSITTRPSTSSTTYISHTSSQSSARNTTISRAQLQPTTASTQSSAQQSTPSISTPFSSTPSTILNQNSSSSNINKNINRRATSSSSTNLSRLLPTTVSRNIHTVPTLQPPTFELRRSRKESDRKYSFKCCFSKCNNNNRTPGVSFTKIPRETVEKADMTKPRNVITYQKKRYFTTCL